METTLKLQKGTKVKNKTPAEIQITAEQILKEAHDRREDVKEKPKQKITDAEELSEYRFHKRKFFEDVVRRNNHNFSNWLKYAAWEESQNEYDRARSVYERVLEIDHRNPAIWTRYVEFEMRCKNINLARNLWDRACTLLPRVDQFWFKYAYMEEMLNNVSAARQIFERWMTWEPPVEAWDAFVAFEVRYKEFKRAREILVRLVQIHPKPEHWIKLARFVLDHHDPPSERTCAARTVYERALEVLGEQFVSSALLLSFAKFETSVNEIDRARAIYKQGLALLPKSESESLYNQYINFERRYGDRPQIDQAVTERRRQVYSSELELNKANYDVWFDLLRLEESSAISYGFLGSDDPDSATVSCIRDLYERAVAQVPIASKREWRRYIYVWLNYAAFEETLALDRTRAGRVLKACLDIVPHKQFTFAKVWIYYAKLLVRLKDLLGSRKLLGCALGTCPKHKLFKGYIQLELELLEFDRVRKLYEKYLQFAPDSCQVWAKYAELERTLGDFERCRGIFEVAISQPVLDAPELIWQAYIDFEVLESEWERARTLYQRLLERTTHVRVYIGLARLEMKASTSRAECLANARAVYEQAAHKLKDRQASEERVVLLEAWRDFEVENGDAASVQNVVDQLPQVKRQASGKLSYVFPDEQQEPQGGLLEMAKAWKAQFNDSD